MTQSETITLTRAELNQLIDDKIASAQGGGVSKLPVLKKITERRVEVRLVDEKVVVGYKNRGNEKRPVFLYEMPDPKDSHRMISYVDIILEDGSCVPGVDFKQFREESLREKCFIKSTREIPFEISQGMVRKQEVEDYATVELDYLVPLLVEGKNRIFTVALEASAPGGAREVVVHEGFVNIA